MSDQSDTLAGRSNVSWTEGDIDDGRSDPMASTTHVLLMQARSELGLNQRTLAKLLGVSMRTVQRHEDDGGLPIWGGHHAKLLKALHPRNPALASQIAAAHGKTLADYGIQEVATGPQPPARATRMHADSVICAAADAFGIVPRDARPLVHAILTRVQELNVELGSLLPLIRADAEGEAKAGKK